MTMLDDDRLASLFARAAETFEVPVTGPDDIVARASGRVATADEEATDGDRLDETAGEDTDTDTMPFGETAPFGQTAPTGRVRRVTGVARRHRVLSVAACVVVLLALAGAVGALVRSPARPAVTAAPATAHAPVKAPVHAPSTKTTTPAFSSSGLSAQASGAAPLGAARTATNGSAAPTSPSPPQTTPSLPSGAVGQPAKIEQTGSLTLTVGRGKLNRTVTQLTALAGAYGGFVANSQTQSGASPSGSVTLQVPVDSFAAVLTRAQALGKPSDLTTKATDVTGQYVDLQARITALQASRQQYLTILAKATTVGDVLAVQEQIDSIQSQIEQLQGQLQLLTSQTSYSTLTVTVGEGTPPPPPGPLPESGLVRAWHASIGGFVTGVEGVIRIAGPLLFALLLLGVLLAGGRALWRRYQRHNL
jgi:Domain of unknown function (DUF4349)